MTSVNGWLVGCHIDPVLLCTSLFVVDSLAVAYEVSSNNDDSVESIGSWLNTSTASRFQVWRVDLRVARLGSSFLEVGVFLKDVRQTHLRK